MDTIRIMIGNFIRGCSCARCNASLEKFKIVVLRRISWSTVVIGALMCLCVSASYLNIAPERLYVSATLFEDITIKPSVNMDITSTDNTFRPHNDSENVLSSTGIEAPTTQESTTKRENHKKLREGGPLHSNEYTKPVLLKAETNLKKQSQVDELKPMDENGGQEVALLNDYSKLNEGAPLHSNESTKLVLINAETNLQKQSQNGELKGTVKNKEEEVALLKDYKELIDGAPVHRNVSTRPVQLKAETNVQMQLQVDEKRAVKIKGEEIALLKYYRIPKEGAPLHSNESTRPVQLKPETSLQKQSQDGELKREQGKIALLNDYKKVNEGATLHSNESTKPVLLKAETTVQKQLQIGELKRTVKTKEKEVALLKDYKKLDEDVLLHSTESAKPVQVPAGTNLQMQSKVGEKRTVKIKGEEIALLKYYKKLNEGAPLHSNVSAMPVQLKAERKMQKQSQFDELKRTVKTKEEEVAQLKDYMKLDERAPLHSNESTRPVHVKSETTLQMESHDSEPTRGLEVAPLKYYKKLNEGVPLHSNESTEPVILKAETNLQKQSHVGELNRTVKIKDEQVVLLKDYNKLNEGALLHSNESTKSVLLKSESNLKKQLQVGEKRTVKIKGQDVTLLNYNRKLSEGASLHSNESTRQEQLKAERNLRKQSQVDELKRTVKTKEEEVALLKDYMKLNERMSLHSNESTKPVQVKAETNLQKQSQDGELKRGQEAAPLKYYKKLNEGTPLHSNESTKRVQLKAETNLQRQSQVDELNSTVQIKEEKVALLNDYKKLNEGAPMHSNESTEPVLLKAETNLQMQPQVDDKRTVKIKEQDMELLKYYRKLNRGASLHSNESTKTVLLKAEMNLQKQSQVGELKRTVKIKQEEVAQLTDNRKLNERAPLHINESTKPVQVKAETNLQKQLQVGELKQTANNKGVAQVKANGDLTSRGQRKYELLGRTDMLSERPCKHKLPDAIIIGVMKAGTEAFATYLSINPQVAMSLNVRSTLFFGKNYEKGMQWYRHQMMCSTDDQVTVEKAPQYFPATMTAPKRIYNMNRNIKLILIVRDPIDRAMSHYLQVNSSYPESIHGRSFEQLVFTSDGTVNANSNFIEQSRYAPIVAQWLNYFKLSQILIVDGDAFKVDQIASLSQAERFLGIKRYITADKFTFDKEKGFYCLNVNGVKSCLGKGKGREHPTLNINAYRKLKAYFKPYNDKFSKMVGKQFQW